jgi:transaldolase
MKFFIDTANLSQIHEAAALGILDGVTTNPSLMAKEGISGAEAINQHYKTICSIVDGDISAEVLSTDFDSIIREGKVLAALHPNIVVKVPMIKDGIKAIKWFTDNGIKTNCTLDSILGLLKHPLTEIGLAKFMEDAKKMAKKEAAQLA